MARLVAQRSTCPRLACGAVLVSPENQVLATGYNGAVRGEPHCSDIGCLMDGNHCVRAIHAEANAILQCARLGVAARHATMYVTHRSCMRCAGLIIQAGIARLVYDEPYTSDNLFYVKSRLAAAGIAVDAGPRQENEHHRES